jgi:hypothetical protein
MAAVSLPNDASERAAPARAAEAESGAPSDLRATLASREEPTVAATARRAKPGATSPKAAASPAAASKAAASPAAASKAEPKATAAKPAAASWSSWLVPALLAFAVAYGLVSHFKPELVELFSGPAQSSAPASPR